MIASDGRPRPVGTPLVSRGLSKYAAEPYTVVLPNLLYAWMSKGIPQPPSPSCIDWSTTCVTVRPFAASTVSVTFGLPVGNLIPTPKETFCGDSVGCLNNHIRPIRTTSPTPSLLKI